MKKLTKNLTFGVAPPRTPQGCIRCGKVNQWEDQWCNRCRGIRMTEMEEERKAAEAGPS